MSEKPYLYEAPIARCEASSHYNLDYACDNAVDTLPGTDWAAKGTDNVGAWIKVSAGAGTLDQDGARS